MFFLSLGQFKNLRLILTHKYLIIITKNGIIKFQTNFYNLFINNENLYFDFNNYTINILPIMFYYANKNYINLTTKIKLLKFYKNYLNNFYNAIYSAIYPYKITLLLKGIGYKFVIENNILKIRVGYSHFISYKLNPEIYFNIENPTTLTLYSNNKLILTKVASFLKHQKSINFYKGTGIFYIDECITLKKKNNNKNKNAK